MFLSPLASIPSPSQAEWHLGPLPIRAYALAILLGIFAAWWILDRRYTAKGGPKDAALDVAFWMVPFGIVGARIYHVISSPDAYFGPDGDPVRALYIWQGGLGIWGAVALGAVGAWIGLRRRGLHMAPFADALAPGLLVAQAIGRLGNWFNNELFGRATDLPWALRIYEWDGGRAVLDAAGNPVVLGTFHPTFLYELLWNLAAAAFVIWADKRFVLGHGRAFALYVASSCLGRLWIELLRTDPAETFFGVRLNVFTSIVVGLLAVAYLVWQRGRPREVIDRGATADERPVVGRGAGEPVGEGEDAGGPGRRPAEN